MQFLLFWIHFVPSSTRDHPVIPSALLTSGRSNNLESTWDMVDMMKTALEEASANVTTGPIRKKTHAVRSRQSETFSAGDEVLLPTKNL